MILERTAPAHFYTDLGGELAQTHGLEAMLQKSGRKHSLANASHKSLRAVYERHSSRSLKKTV